MQAGPFPPPNRSFFELSCTGYTKSLKVETVFFIMNYNAILYFFTTKKRGTFFFYAAVHYASQAVDLLGKNPQNKQKTI